MPLQIDYRPIAELTPYGKNSRTHSDEQVAQIAASIQEFGWTNPVLIDSSDGIIAGHGRVLAAQRLGLTEVPTIRLEDMTEAQRRAYIIADNKLAENAGWDVSLLKTELSDLQGMEFDLSLLGFDPSELQALLAPEALAGETDPDNVPDAPADPVTVPGDVWLLGRHRIVCGDSTDALVVDKALNGVSPHLMVTDPPYGVEYDATARRSVQSKGSKAATGKVENDDRADWREAWALFPGDVAYIWHADKGVVPVIESLTASGFEIRQQIIWAKNKFVIGRGHYQPQHEPCFYAVRKGQTGHWAGDRKQSTLWSIEHTKSETGHSTQKPVEAMKRPIENNSSPGQAVYEPFSGSGTTIIACEMTGRVCHAIELNPAYVDVAVLRWQEFTGKAATLEGDGRTFTEILAERTPGAVLTAAPAPAAKEKKK